MDWNILAAAFMRKERSLLNLLRNYGEFRGAGYRDVIIGRVEDVHGFLEAIETRRRERPGKFGPLSQIVPIEKSFDFDLADFRDRLKEALLPYARELENNSKFCCIRRDHVEAAILTCGAAVCSVIGG